MTIALAALMLAAPFVGPDTGSASLHFGSGMMSWTIIATAHQIADRQQPSRDEPARTGIIIERRIIIRVPRELPPPEEPAANAAILQGGPRCIALRSIQWARGHGDGAMLFGAGGRSYQAELGRGCRSMDFHAGIYISPSADGLLCTGRDMLQARNGARCAVVQFMRKP